MAAAARAHAAQLRVQLLKAEVEAAQLEAVAAEEEEIRAAASPGPQEAAVARSTPSAAASLGPQKAAAAQGKPLATAKGCWSGGIATAVPPPPPALVVEDPTDKPGSSSSGTPQVAITKPGLPSPLQPGMVVRGKKDGTSSSDSAGAVSAASVEGVQGSKWRPKVPATWPEVVCTTCEQLGHWKSMRYEKVWQHFQKTSTDEEDKYHYQYTCASCVSTAEGISEPEALALIKEKAYASKAKRATKFATRRSEAKELYQGLAGKELRAYTLSQLDDVLDEMAGALLVKMRQLTELVKESEEFQKLVARMKVCSTAAEAQEMSVAIDSMLDATKFLAFASRPDAIQRRFIMASTYDDSWSVSKDGKGYLRSFFVCCAGVGYGKKCMHMTPSKRWRTLHEDPLAWSQRWYCTWCNARYCAGFGCYVELCIEGVLFSLRAEVPDENILDVRAIKHEGQFEFMKDPGDLYNNLHSLQPTVVEDMVQEVDKEKMLYKLSSWESFHALPEFSWYDIFPRKESKKSRR